MSKKKITIVGAGLSGMVAGINLANEGYDVEIWDAAKSIGEHDEYHPSIHATPIFPKEVSEYLGVDITPCFGKTKRMRFYLSNKAYDLNPHDMHMVERGGRKTSIDSHLYEIALEHGIKFHFNNPVKKLDDIPKGSIVSTGFDKDIMDALDLPCILGYGIFARKKTDPKYEDTLMGYTGSYTSDYGYLSVLNGIMSYVLFTRGVMDEKSAEIGKQHLIDTEGLEFPKWTFMTQYLPEFNSESLKLFKNDLILSGTLSGMMDPAACYGILGALVSGKVAALAVTDKEKAIKEFDRLNKNYHRIRIISKYLLMIPGRVKLLNLMFSYPYLFTGIMGKIDDGIPGYDGHWGVDLITSSKKLPKLNCIAY